ncbi:MAG: SLC13 family permease [Thiogranum sp.]|nr:SLC13 family permease [Thiogranum sp.]
MEVEATIVWLVLGGVVILFISDRVRPDAAALGGLLTLVLTGSLNPGDALAGFSSPAVITIASLLVLGAAIERSGVVRWIADGLHRLAGKSQSRMLLAATLAPALLSGVINIIATVSVFIPVLLRLALKAHQSPAHLLLPMACVAMAGANLTLIGASHNLVVNDILRQRTGDSFGFFEFAPVGLVMIVIATVYSLTTARWLLPARDLESGDGQSDQTRELIRRYAFSERVWELEVPPDSPLVGSEVNSLRLTEDYGLSLISLIRANQHHLHLDPASVFAAGDVLLLGGRRECVEALSESVDGLDLHGAPAYRDDFSAGSAELIEVLVPPHSPAIGQSLSDLDLRARSGLTAIALWRDGAPRRTGVATTPLRAGDAILLYGDKRYTRGFEPQPDFMWLRPPRKSAAPAKVRRLAPWTVLIFLLVIAAAALDWFPIAVTALAGALAVTLIGALDADRAYTRIDWSTLVLIAAMLPFATALNITGASADLATWLTDGLGHWGPLAVMMAVAGTALVLTQALHNAAVAAVMMPVALDAAAQLAVNPKTFAVAVLVAASMSVLLPAGHPAPLLVRDSGGYRSSDYLRFGSGMAVLTLLVIATMVPMLWPFDAG